MKSLRILIVDDEPIARTVIRQELACLNGVEVVGEADSGASALIEISALRPNLVFLDIQMPLMSGFEVINQLEFGHHLPAIVMVTAFNQHSIQAFEAGAIDYLLKPVSRERLYVAVERASRLCRHPKLVAENIAQLQQLGVTSQQQNCRKGGSSVLLTQSR